MKHDDRIIEAFELLKRIEVLSGSSEKDFNPRRLLYADVLAAMTYLRGRKGWIDEDGKLHQLD